MPTWTFKDIQSNDPAQLLNELQELTRQLSYHFAYLDEDNIPSLKGINEAISDINETIKTEVDLLNTEMGSLAEGVTEISATVTDLEASLTDKADKKVTEERVLSASAWASGMYIISSENVKSDSAIFITPNKSNSNTQFNAYFAANMVGVGQADGTFVLYAYGEVPTVDIPITVVYI